MTDSTYAALTQSKEDISTGGLQHLYKCVATLNDDFTRLNEEIERLANVLDMANVFPPAEGETGTVSVPRSLIANIVEQILWLQKRSESQRNAITAIREAIQ